MALDITRLAARGALVATAACVAAAVAPVSSAVADSTSGHAGVTLAPAHTTAHLPASRSYFIRHLAANGGYRDSVLVTNMGSTGVTLQVSAVRAMTAVTTGVVYADDNTGDARWVQPDVTSVRVPAHATVPVGFALHVPANARPGNHLAGIAFTDPRAITSTSGQLSVQTHYRNVIGVQTNVTGPAAAHFTLRSATLSAARGTGLATLTLRTANDGRLFDHGRLTLELSRAGYTRTVTRQLNLVLAGDTIDLPTQWPTDLQPGDYALVATLTGHDFPTATLRTTVTLTDTALGGPTAAIRPFLTTPSPKPAASWNIAAMVTSLAAAVLIGVIATCWLLVGRRRRRRDAAPAVDVTRKSEELVGV